MFSRFLLKIPLINLPQAFRHLALSNNLTQLLGCHPTKPRQLFLLHREFRIMRNCHMIDHAPFVQHRTNRVDNLRIIRKELFWLSIWQAQLLTNFAPHSILIRFAPCYMASCRIIPTARIRIFGHRALLNKRIASLILDNHPSHPVSFTRLLRISSLNWPKDIIFLINPHNWLARTTFDFARQHAIKRQHVTKQWQLRDIRVYPNMPTAWNRNKRPVNLLAKFPRQIVIAERVVIAMHPTWGLDVSATRFVREQLLEERKNGAAVLLVSEDLDELLALSDRLAVICKGELMGIIGDPSAVTLETIGLMMAGTPVESIANPTGGLEQCG